MNVGHSMNQAGNGQPAEGEQLEPALVPEDDGTLSRELIAAFKPQAPQVEAMRALRTQLILGSFSATANALAIVSPASGDGRTFIAANLAIVYSQLGKRTLLVDAHLQNARIHELFGVQNVRGLSAALMSGATREPTVVAVPHFRNLFILPGGAQPLNADDLLAGESFARLSRSLTSQYDLVLFDTPPGLASSGVDWIAHQCGKALLVVRQNKTRFTQADSFLKRINSRAEVVGSVMNSYRRPFWRLR